MTAFPSPTKAWHSKLQPSTSPTRPELSVKGKTVVVAGGGTGIGAETARYFAQAGAYRVGLLGRREQPLLDNKASIEKDFPGVEVLVASTDITNKSQVDAAFAKFAGDGKINVLVSAAAETGPHESVRDVDPDKFVSAVDNNVKGALLVAQVFLRHASPDATAMNISTSAAHMNFVPGFSAYSVAKLAVYRLWDSLAFANPKMTIFHVHPGVVDTAMNREAGGVDAVGASDDVSLPAGFILWLASPEARFLKGKFLWTNWDVDELKARASEIEAGPQLSIGLAGWPFDKADYKFETNSTNASWSS